MKIAIISILFLLTACYHEEKVSSELKMRKGTKYKYEIEVLVYHEGRGNIHQLDASKYSFKESSWLYSNNNKGIVYARDLVLTSVRNETDSTYTQSNLRGFVSFKKDSILIRLIVPHYIDEDTIVDEWMDYEYNGNYKLRKEGGK